MPRMIPVVGDMIMNFTPQGAVEKCKIYGVIAKELIAPFGSKTPAIQESCVMVLLPDDKTGWFKIDDLVWVSNDHAWHANPGSLMS